MAVSVTVTLRSDLAELGRLAEAVEGFGEAAGLPPKLVYSLNLVLDELVTNTISYGYELDERDRPIELRLEIEGHRLTAVLTDDGKAFNPLDRDPPDVESDLDDRGIGGLGVHFVRTMMDEVQYDRIGNSNRLTLVKHLR